METVERIAPSIVGETPHYYYWQVSCLALWCEANGIMQSLARAPDLVEGIEAGLRIDRTYEGGGFDRAAGTIYAKLPEWNPLGGPSGDIEKELEHFQKSLRSPSYPRAKHPEDRNWELSLPNARSRTGRPRPPRQRSAKSYKKLLSVSMKGMCRRPRAGNSARLRLDEGPLNRLRSN